MSEKYRDQIPVGKGIQPFVVEAQVSLTVAHVGRARSPLLYSVVFAITKGNM